MELTAETATERGVTLVTAHLANPSADPRRFRLSSTLDGPVWPPRRNGCVEDGWDEAGYEGHLPPGDSLALGFATPAPPADEPLVVVWTERAERETDPDNSSTVRDYRDPRPPRRAVTPHSPTTAGTRLVASIDDGASGDVP